MTFDGKCEMLARQWLHGGYLMDQREFDRRVPELAQRIQQAIEDYCEEEKLEEQ